MRSVLGSPVLHLVRLLSRLVTLYSALRRQRSCLRVDCLVNRVGYRGPGLPIRDKGSGARVEARAFHVTIVSSPAPSGVPRRASGGSGVPGRLDLNRDQEPV